MSAISGVSGCSVGGAAPLPPASAVSSGSAAAPTAPSLSTPSPSAGQCGAASSSTQATSGSGRASQAVGLKPAGGGQQVSQSSQTQSLTHSSTFAQQAGQDNVLSALVMALVHYLLTGEEKDKEKQNPLAALVGMALLSSLNQTAGEVSYFQHHSSQYSLTVSTNSASAVQASSYGQTSGSATSGAATGGSIDVCG